MALNLTVCPHCKAKKLPEDQQPYPSLHAFSIKYECGAQIVMPIEQPKDDIPVSRQPWGSASYEWETKCTRETNDR